jgi:hypothetical protein
MFDTFRDKFLSMVAALRSDDSIVVVVAEIVPPAPAEIAEVERTLGSSLGASISEFYTACGGVKLIWTPVDPDEDGIWTAAQAARVFAEPAKCGPWLFKSGDQVGAPQGCIWIPSCKQVFGKPEEWSDLISGQDEIFDEYRDQLGQPDAAECLVPFDYASAFFDFAFLLNGKPDPKLVRGEDNGASFSDSRLVSLPEYLEILIASKGNVEARVDALAVDADEDDENEEEDEDEDA